MFMHLMLAISWQVKDELVIVDLIYGLVRLLIKILGFIMYYIMLTCMVFGLLGF
jgi:hypothetical protein